LYGLQKFGKGRWKKISLYVPDRYEGMLWWVSALRIPSFIHSFMDEWKILYTHCDPPPHIYNLVLFVLFPEWIIGTFFYNRSLVQIKSHAQKVLKRFDAGEVRNDRKVAQQ
jgi:hypothetical protein